MALNELCTNAVKYGALSNPGGRVEIKSILDQEAQRFKLIWEEKGGPVVKEPKRRSFGTRLIESSLARLLQGDARLRFEPSGVICEFDFPLASLQTLSKQKNLRRPNTRVEVLPIKAPKRLVYRPGPRHHGSRNRGRPAPRAGRCRRPGNSSLRSDASSCASPCRSTRRALSGRTSPTRCARKAVTAIGPARVASRARGFSLRCGALRRRNRDRERSVSGSRGCRSVSVLLHPRAPRINQRRIRRDARLV